MNRKLEKVDFTNKEIFLGLDVHNRSWRTTIHFGDTMTTKNFTADPEKLSSYLNKNYPGAIFKATYEAGCFGFWIKEELDRLGIETIVINPADIPTTDKEKRNKNDKSDSRKIAMALKSGLLKGIYAPDRESLEKRDILRLRSDLSKKSTRCKNQIKAILKRYGIRYPEEYEQRGSHWSRNFIKWLNSIKFFTVQGKQVMDSRLREFEFIRQEILTVTRQIRYLSREDTYAKKCSILVGIPGIGLIGAMTLLTEIVDINRFKSRDEFCSYLGLTPNEQSSGDKRRIGHMTKRCNHRLRTILVEGAWTAVRKDPALMLYFEKLKKKIVSNKAIIKVAKKLGARIRYLLINETEYVKGVVA
jgi:transposase